MSESQVLEISRQALQVALMAAAPMLAVSMLMGLLISLIQVVTSLQDATLTFIPKVLAVAAALVIAGPWILHLLVDFTRMVFSPSLWVPV